MRKGPVDSVAASELHSEVQAGHEASRRGGADGQDVSDALLAAECVAETPGSGHGVARRRLLTTRASLPAKRDERSLSTGHVGGPAACSPAARARRLVGAV